MYQDKEIYFITIIGIVLGLLLVSFIISILYLYHKRQKKQEQEIERMKVEYEKEALRSQLEIQENTLKTMAQELHDNIGQMLSVVKLSLSVAPLEKEHKAYEPIFESRQVLQKAIADLSNLTKSLHAERISQVGLPDSIQFELIAIERAGVLKTQFSQHGDTIDFPEQTAVFLFRIFQESLNNILKHARAMEVIVDLNYSDTIFVMEISDDGIGFNVKEKKESSKAGSGVGLKSLYNRASIIGADISITSKPGKGTTVLIELPLASES